MQSFVSMKLSPAKSFAFLLFSFSLFHILSFWFRAVDLADLSAFELLVSYCSLRLIVGDNDFGKHTRKCVWIMDFIKILRTAGGCSLRVTLLLISTYL